MSKATKILLTVGCIVIILIGIGTTYLANQTRWEKDIVDLNIYTDDLNGEMQRLLGTKNLSAYKMGGCKYTITPTGEVMDYILYVYKENLVGYTEYNMTYNRLTNKVVVKKEKLVDFNPSTSFSS